MVKRKPIRTRGKLKFSRYFKELKEGDRVGIIREPSVPSSFPERMIGRTGIVEGKRGRVYIIRVKDHDKEKKFLISPIHLEKVS